MTPLEWAEVAAVGAFVGVVVAAGVAAIVRREKLLRLFVIAGVLLLGVLAVSQGNPDVVRELRGWFP
ncbi:MULTISPECIES: hypothetical protein [unclassified Amycolatopsis]|uniref:hypothetical protein n=1 Tax=unclassified Amycolatopsis TaxID=2618356 RepID=UPI000F77FF28|nr:MULTISPECIES: hypothetical protein [unclassified Amycolatopsis]